MITLPVEAIGARIKSRHDFGWDEKSWLLMPHSETNEPSDDEDAEQSARQRLVAALKLTQEAILLVGLDSNTSKLVDLYLEAMRELASLIEDHRQRC